MRTTMKETCFIIFFAVFIPIVKSSQVDFLDCGSLLKIQEVKVSNCAATPCVFSPGDYFYVEVDVFQDFKLDKTEFFTEAYLGMFGQKWPLEITPIDPCIQWMCPLREFTNLTYVAQIHLQEGLIKRPADVKLQSSYDNGGVNVIAVCVQFDVTLQ